MAMYLVATVLYGVLLPWGVYALERRFRAHEELSPLLQAGTLVLVLTATSTAMLAFRASLEHQTELLVFTFLGLLAADIALFGHIMVSLLSRILVDLVTSNDETVNDKPRFGYADALEKHGDLEGALAEYFVMSRVFAKNPEVAARIVAVLLKLSRPEEALPWYEHLLRHHNDPGRLLTLADTLSGAFANQPDGESRARYVLDDFLRRFPGTPEAAGARAGLERLGAPDRKPAMSERLTALAEMPLSAEPAPEPEEERKPGISLEPM